MLMMQWLFEQNDHWRMFVVMVGRREGMNFDWNWCLGTIVVEVAVHFVNFVDVVVAEDVVDDMVVFQYELVVY